ncbi:kelch domain-containing protein, putative [Bodo saltans]|uniref:Kelch domain-containing protein, putative n=1 Tax=Bodo saltans TaxID=75058 RepID=A0A0S4IIH8_BODSA|nr:kelch domain-containing protein, putative [Bodo saltans]|eukprot:CUE71860.1 kelch domain-containing protein, putative [Bodo saltans]
MYSLPLLETGISRTFEKIESPPGVTEDDVPCARRGHTLVPYKDGACILFGGHSRVSLNDAWVLEADLTWRELPTRGNNPTYPFSGTPECRYGHTSVIYREHMYVFGGFGASGPAEPHVWALNLETYIWAVVDVAVGVSDGPGGRFGHTASLVGCRMVIFGGMDGFPHGKSLNDAYQLNLVTLEWTKLLVGGGSDGTESGGGGDDAAQTSGSVQALLGPQARRSHAAVLDSSGGRVIIFGGWGECAVQHDNTFLEMEISPPTLREIARDWIGSKVVFPRSASSMSATTPKQQERPNHQLVTCDT